MTQTPMNNSISNPKTSPKTTIPEIDAFIEAEIELIGGEPDKGEQAQLFRIFHNGIRAILMAQLQLPAKDGPTAPDRARRRIDIIKTYLKNSKETK